MDIRTYRLSTVHAASRWLYCGKCRRLDAYTSRLVDLPQYFVTFYSIEPRGCESCGCGGGGKRWRSVEEDPRGTRLRWIALELVYSCCRRYMYSHVQRCVMSCTGPLTVYVWQRTSTESEVEVGNKKKYDCLKMSDSKT